MLVATVLYANIISDRRRPTLRLPFKSTATNY